MANITYRFTAGTKAQAEQVNKNFDDCMDAINSNITSIEQINTTIEGLETSSANINGDATQTFSVANPVLNSDAVNKSYLKQWTGNSINYINGLGITKVSDDTIGIDVGSCYDSTDTKLLVLGSNLDKQNQTQASSSVYYVYLIGKDVGGEDILISTLSIDPNLPDEYLYYRRIGSYTTDSDNKISQINVEKLSQYSDANSLLNQNSSEIMRIISPDLTAGISISSGWVSTSAGWIYATRWGENVTSNLYVNGVTVLYASSLGGYSTLGHGSLIYVDKNDTITFSRFTCKFYPCKGVEV